MIKIFSCQNGFYLENTDDHDDKALPERLVFEEGVNLLHYLADIVTDRGSRYSDERVYVIVAPGDKSEKWTEAHSDVIFGKEEENDNCSIKPDNCCGAV